MKVHRESAENQATARRNQDAAREELDKRLEGTPVEYNGETVLVTTVTTREILTALKAESYVIKVEALAQRSYDVHQAIFGQRGTTEGGIEDFIAALEQEKQTGRCGAVVVTRRSSRVGSLHSCTVSLNGSRGPDFVELWCRLLQCAAGGILWPHDRPHSRP